MSIGTTPSENLRLARLLDFLRQDFANESLLADALQLAIDTQDLIHGQALLEHVRNHVIRAPTICALTSHMALILGDHAAAAEYGDVAINSGIQHPAVRYNAAYGFFYRGNYNRTAQILNPLCADEMECSAATLVLQARALHHLQRIDEALSLMKRAVQQFPDDHEATGLQALLLCDAGESKLALDIALQTLEKNPNQLDALLACGSVHLEQGSNVAASKTYLHTVNIHPQCGRAWSGLAQIEFSEMDFTTAETHLDTAVKLMPDHIGTWHLLAWIYILRDDSVRARAALEKSYELDRNFGETHGGFAVVDVLDGHHDQARKGIRRALKLNRNSMSALYAEFLLLTKNGKSKEAQQLVDRVLDSTAPSGTQTSRVLVQKWLQKHAGKSPEAPPNHH